MVPGAPAMHAMPELIGEEFKGQLLGLSLLGQCGARGPTEQLDQRQTATLLRVAHQSCGGLRLSDEKATWGLISVATAAIEAANEL